MLKQKANCWLDTEWHLSNKRCKALWNSDYLDPQDSKDNEEGAAYQNNVPNRSKRGDESLHNKL